MCHYSFNPLLISFSSFLDNLPRLSAPGYLPSEQDLLRTRIKTTGITEVLFELKGLTFRQARCTSSQCLLQGD